MTPLRRRIVLAAAALGLAAGPVLAPLAWAGVPADAVNGDMSLGNAKAKVQVIEYASAACPHCAHFNATIFPAFKAKYVDTGRAYYTLKEFLTPPNEAAAAGFLVARCAGRAKYFTVLDQVFRSQAQWTAGNIGQVISQVGVANGLTIEQVNSCLTDPAALDALNARVDKAMEKDQINSTPTIVVNGKQVAVATLADLEKAIAAAARTPARPKSAGKRR